MLQTYTLHIIHMCIHSVYQYLFPKTTKLHLHQFYGVAVFFFSGLFHTYLFSFTKPFYVSFELAHAVFCYVKMDNLLGDRKSSVIACSLLIF